MQPASTATHAPLSTIVYPDSDGKPMAESDDHIEELVSARFAIKDHFRVRPDVYVAGNMLLYYEEGNPQGCVAPDVFVVFGVEKKRRRSYKLWEEGKAPAFVLEVTSKSTRMEDLGQKKVVYAMLGVAEYFLFDPWGEYLSPSLQAHRLRRGDYDRIPAGPGGVIESRKLGLRLVPEAGHLRLVEIRSGRSLLTPDEGLESARREAARAQSETARAQSEAVARLKAERRVQELEARLSKVGRRRS